MAKKKTEDTIVVTLDAGAAAAPAVALAAALAKARQRALHGLFIEDADLLNVARLPFTREVLRYGRETRDLSGLDLERSMARLANEFRLLLEAEARQNALRCSFSQVRGSKRLLARGEAEDSDLLVIGQARSRPSPRVPRILLLQGQQPAVLQTLATVLEAPQYLGAEVLVSGDFDSDALKEVLDQHPGTTRRLMGAPALRELLVSPRYRPSLVLLSRSAPTEDTEACLRLADCPVIIAA